jgi:hypothetical protein
MIANYNEENEKLQKELTKQNVNDLNHLLSTTEGRRFIMWLFKLCGQESTSFTGNSQTYFNEGMRNVALVVKFEALKPGINGMNLLQKAEQEYFVLANDIKENITKGVSKNNDGIKR